MKLNTDRKIGPTNSEPHDTDSFYIYSKGQHLENQK